MRSPIPIGNPPITQDWLGIWYKPLSGEPIPKMGPLIPWYVVPQNPEMDPFKLAEELINRAPKDARAYLLVPGTRFDRFGARYGRGGGWYDRFLSRLPRSWLRIGIAKSHQISETELERNPWDEPVDWLLVSPE
jgi:5,10-methenyltetrahydrofolate synthetase